MHFKTSAHLHYIWRSCYIINVILNPRICLMRYLIDYLEVLYRPFRFFKSNFDAGLEGVKVQWAGSLLALLVITLYSLSSVFSPAGLGHSAMGKGIQIIGFTLGFVITFFFRAYFMKMILEKGSGIQITTLQSVFIISSAWSPYLLMHLLMLSSHLFFDLDSQYLSYLNEAFQVWNLALVLIGFRVLTNIQWFRGIILIVLMYGFEYMGRVYLFGQAV